MSTGRKRVAFETLGCKLNQAETEGLARELMAAGCEIVTPADQADIYILNTCTVTHIADRKSRHLLRMARRRNPAAVIVAIGCYAESSPKELGQIEEVDLVLSYKGKEHLMAYLEESGCLLRQAMADQKLVRLRRTPAVFRTRSAISIQQGCTTPCTYCIVPSVRKRETSRPVDEVIADINARAAEGYREVVLTGTKVGAYQSNGTNLTVLLKHVLVATTIPRIRLSSLQPQEITPELIALWHDARLCRHFHLSLQSGSETVLQRMRRRYSLAQYQQVVELIRSLLPEAAITTDIIVGFPGETEAEFMESLEFCRKMKFARIHVFPYSPRRNTVAASMTDQVADAVKKQRVAEMLALGEESARAFHSRFLGNTMLVLWEQQEKGVWSGLTDNYIKVYLKSDDDLTNRITQVKLVEVGEDGCGGVKQFIGKERNATHKKV